MRVICLCVHSIQPEIQSTSFSFTYRSTNLKPLRACSVTIKLCRYQLFGAIASWVTFEDDYVRLKSLSREWNQGGTCGSEGEPGSGEMPTWHVSLVPAGCQVLSSSGRRWSPIGIIKIVSPHLVLVCVEILACFCSLNVSPCWSVKRIFAASRKK